MNIKTLAYTCICALLTALPLAARAEGDAGDVTYATVWEQRKNWRKFNSEQLILYTEILIEKAQTRAPDDNSADLSSVIGRLAYNCSEEQLRELDEKLCTFEIGNAVNFYPAFPKTA